MKESQLINQSSNNTSYTNWLWSYGKQALKGVSVMGVGVLGYMGLRGYWQSKGVGTQAKSESTDLIAASEATTIVVDKGLTTLESSSVGGQSVWDTAVQSLQYRHKRGVVPQQPYPLGVERVLNPVTIYNQASPSVIALNNGDTVVVYDSEGEDGSLLGVFAILSSNPRTHIKVNSYRTNNQFVPDVGTPDGNRVVVTWMSQAQFVNNIAVNSIYATELRVNQTELISTTTELLVSTNPTDAQVSKISCAFPVAPTAVPECEILFHNIGFAGASSYTMVKQTYSNFPTVAGANTAINTIVPNNGHSFGLVAYAPNGRKFYVWTDFQSSGAIEIAGRYYDPSTGWSSEYLVNTNTAGVQTTPCIASSSRGDIAYGWWVDPASTGRYKVVGKIASQNNLLIADEKNIATDLNGEQRNLQVISINSTTYGWLWLWQADGSGDFDVRAQFTASNLSNIGREFCLNRKRTLSQVGAQAVQRQNGYIQAVYMSEGLSGASNSGTDIASMDFQPRIDGIVYNVEYGKTFNENTPDAFTITDSPLVLNPAIDANSTTLYLNPSVGTLEIDQSFLAILINSTLTTYYGNATVFLSNNGSLTIHGIGKSPFSAAVPINDILPHLRYTPEPWYVGPVSTNITAISPGQPTFTAVKYDQVDRVRYAPILQLPSLFWVDQGTPRPLTGISLNNPDPSIQNWYQSNLVPLTYKFDTVLQASIKNQLTGQDIVNVTGAQLTSENIYLYPADTQFPVSFYVSGADDTLGTASQMMPIFYNARPTINTNQLTINYKQTVTVGSNPFPLNVTDDHTNLSNITFYAQAADGRFMRGGLPITSFTQGQMWSGEISFATSGTNVPTKITLIANDGRINSTASETLVGFQSNMPPVIVLNSWNITSSEVVIAGPNHLNGTDDFTPWRDLRAYIVRAENCRFINSNRIGLVLSSFTFGELSDGLIRVEPDGSSNSPVISFVLQDDQYNSTVSPAAVSFKFQGSPSEGNVQADNRGVIGGAIGGIGAALLLAGVGIFGVYRYRRNKQLEDQRSNSPLANALYHELNIAGTEDFRSEKGIAFTNAVDSLNNELIRAGVHIKQMVSEEINEVAYKLANATKAQLGKNINPLDIQDHAESIVATSMTLSGKHKLEGGDVEMERPGV